DLSQGLEVIRADKQDFGLGVVDDIGDLGRREPPVDRHQHGIGLGRAKPDLKKTVMVFVEKRDPRFRPDAAGDEPVGDAARAAVVVNASHGGVYAVYCAAKLGVAAAIFNDAGVGREQAGIGGLDYLQALGIAAASVGHATARIGDGGDMVARGRITHLNALAA